jgi:hypothetical protein
MSGVFQNIDHHPLTALCVLPHAPEAGGTHSPGGEGVVVNILEDASHSSVLYICKYFVELPIETKFQYSDSYWTKKKLLD